MTQAELGAAVGRATNTIGEFERNGVLTVEIISEIDRALGLPVGTVLVRAGYLPASLSLRDQILADPRLSSDGAAMVVSVYDAAVKVAKSATD